MSIVFPPKVSGFYSGGPPELRLPMVIEQELAVLEALPQPVERFFINLEEFPYYSYHLCGIRHKGKEYLFFINKYAPIGALSKVAEGYSIEGWTPDEELPRNEYVDWESGGRLLSRHWTIVPPDIMMLSVDADNARSQQVVAELQNEEFAQFAYWEPKNMGNILFNNWEKPEYW